MAPHPDFDQGDADVPGATDPCLGDRDVGGLGLGDRGLGDDAADGPARSGVEAVRREVVLDAAPAAVWAELTSADALAGWLADEVVLDEVRPGATGTVRDAGGAARPVRVDEVVEGRRLGLTWRDEDDRETVVEITLAPVGDDDESTLAPIGDQDGQAFDRSVPDHAGASGPGEGALGSGGDGAVVRRTRIVVVEVPVATLRLVAPAAARMLVAAPPAGGFGPVARALAGAR